ncbi:unnamed protein product [Nesidiocoris tenuis]|uniref:Uncharacterized protein n=2 Tax=Nesidiocoris tenuis TaxID=355587 RepID=A0ABN7B2A0_9HEMI|nr:Hypothetical protein NTJ_11362 [Nesidiocoris tenuis]CAA9994353.1 unnamed protein product [Nesidiocoris tenuis]
MSPLLHRDKRTISVLLSHAGSGRRSSGGGRYCDVARPPAAPGLTIIRGHSSFPPQMGSISAKDLLSSASGSGPAAIAGRPALLMGDGRPAPAPPTGQTSPLQSDCAARLIFPARLLISPFWRAIAQ